MILHHVRIDDQMSKFIEIISKAGQQSTTPMGFSPASRRSETTSEIVLIANLLPSVSNMSELVDSDADAYLLGADLWHKKSQDGVSKLLGNRIWGLRSFEGLDLAAGQELVEQGCDFVILESCKWEASLLNEEDLGVLVTLRRDTCKEHSRCSGVLEMDENTLHAFSELTHGLLYSPVLTSQPVLMETAIDIQRVINAIDSPLLLETQGGIGSRDVELFRNMGISGIIIDVNGPEDLSIVTDVKMAINSLPKGRSRNGRRDALLPSTLSETPVAELEPEQDDDY